MTTRITNLDDIIVSTDIIERVKELRASADESEDTDGETLLTFSDPSDRDEYESLDTLAEQCEGYGDWDYGEALIRASHFTEYVQELMADIGTIPSDLPWYIKDAIDWDVVAQHIDQDYMDVEFDGITYKIRA
jgi:hypothetical protein